MVMVPQPTFIQEKIKRESSSDMEFYKELSYNKRVKNNALVAQWLEQGSHKPLVVGSSPTERTIHKELRYN